MEDTIAAISTALGVGAISVIRISGDKSLEIINKIFDKDLSNAKSHTIHYGHIIDNSEIIDEVLVSVMLSPKTFTKENIIEINCHGGINTTNKVLELVLSNGARLAEPGEFTKRAFLNGRIDLTQADGIMNLIEAKTDISRKMSINQLNGEASNNIKKIRKKLVDIVSNIEVNIDYPEYEDIEVVTSEKIYPLVLNIKEELEKIIKKSEDGKIINEGIKIGIIGRPNVGKSSLLNTLLEEEKAIVTDIEGTTRDIVEGKIIINGFVCNIIDTAGIRETDNIVEKIGVNKSYDIITSSDLIIMILNNNERITEEELELLSMIKKKNHIIVINKIDLENKLNLYVEDAIKISIKDNTGIEDIKTRISEIFNLDKITTDDMSYLSNARSISLLKQALYKIKESLANIENNTWVDIIELDLKECWNILGEIIGETYTDELIDEIFSRFCLGK
ncbi:MAG: tRNA uridine-5-carboxymethylaminomethyl(34) synthesis GTPase MnmE [Bacilli bacterium]|nr:tRNA uridine-5-carboxymethylaminomethyl(34) synthesis GTPase MnmE [Bacilli bacterium]